jgi:hypothetical protein
MECLARVDLQTRPRFTATSLRDRGWRSRSGGDPGERVPRLPVMNTELLMRSAGHDFGAAPPVPAASLVAPLPVALAQKRCFR